MQNIGRLKGGQEKKDLGNKIDFNNGNLNLERYVKVKIITVCGSYKFKKEMIEITEKMTLQGNCMLTPIELSKPNKEAYTEKEAEIFDKMHKEKIKLADAILVVNVNDYIGNSTKTEIEYAKLLGKEVLYYTDLL